jgi:putative aldouronate transport system substrate-binding protein
MKAWYDKGYINKNPFANTQMSRDSFAVGKSAVAFGNSQNITDCLAKAKGAGFDPEVLPSLSSTGHYIADPYTTNGVAIAASSRNVEKTLQFLDLVMQDPGYGSLVYFGIEGQNWVLTADGKIDLPPGVAPERNSYPWDASGFWFINKDLQKPLAIWDENFIALRRKLATMLVPSSFNGFAFAPDRVRTEVASVNTVWLQYGSPLTVGVLGDVDKAYANLVAKLQAAGVGKVQDEIRRQVAVFLADKKKSK